MYLLERQQLSLCCCAFTFVGYTLCVFVVVAVVVVEKFACWLRARALAAVLRLLLAVPGKQGERNRRMRAQNSTQDECKEMCGASTSSQSLDQSTINI
jgi:hypothetical protein